MQSSPQKAKHPTTWPKAYVCAKVGPKDLMYIMTRQQKHIQFSAVRNPWVQRSSGLETTSNLKIIKLVMSKNLAFT